MGRVGHELVVGVVIRIPFDVLAIPTEGRWPARFIPEGQEMGLRVRLAGTS
jgi:hypothetical protein